MTAYRPMNPARLLVVLALVANADNWHVKRRIVELVGAFPGGHRFTAGDIGEALKIGESTASSYLRELIAARVLWAEGRRHRWLEVNPAIEQWRVDWAVTPAERRARLAAYEAEVSIPPYHRLTLTPMGRRSASAIARLNCWRSLDRYPSGTLVSMTSDSDDGGSSNAPDTSTSQSSKSGLRLLQGKGGGRGGSRKSSSLCSSCGGVDRACSCSADNNSNDDRPQHPDFERLARKLKRRAIPKREGTQPFLKGDPAERFDALLWQHGAEAVDAAIDAVPRDMVPGMVDAIEDFLIAGPPEPMEDPSRVERRRQLERRLVSMRSERDAYTSAGEEPPEDILTVIAECENELQELDRQEGAA